jgi:hypothetical protein
MRLIANYTYQMGHHIIEKKIQHSNNTVANFNMVCLAVTTSDTAELQNIIAIHYCRYTCVYMA